MNYLSNLEQSFCQFHNIDIKWAFMSKKKVFQIKLITVQAIDYYKFG